MCKGKKADNGEMEGKKKNGRAVIQVVFLLCLT